MSGTRRNATSGPKWEDNYLYNGQLSVSRCINTVIIFQHSVFNIEIKGSVQMIQKIGENFQIQWRLEMTSMQSGNRYCQIMTENREPTNEMNKEDPTQSILVWLQPFRDNLEDLEAHVLGGSGRELRFVGRRCLKSGNTKKEKQTFILGQKPKEIYSARRKVWWPEVSRAQSPQRRTWILEKSPIRCRGTSSRHSVESVSNQNFTGDGDEFTEVPKAVEEAKSCSYVQFVSNLASVVKNYHRIIEQIHFIDQKQVELQNELYVEQKKRQTCPRRLNAKEVLFSLWQIVQQRIRIPRTHSETGIHREERFSAENLMATGKSFDLKNQKMTQKLGKIFGLHKDTSKIVIMLNREFNIRAKRRILPYFARFTLLNETPPRRKNYGKGLNFCSLLQLCARIRSDEKISRKFFT